jgi:hypothetical protein
MRRNEKDIPEGCQEAAGFALKRNPGATGIWVTRSYVPFRAHGGESGILFKLGDPEKVLWFANGRQATRAEVLASIETGLPLLRAQKEDPEAEKAFKRAIDRAMMLVPA